MSTTVNVEHLGEDRFELRMGSHSVLVDQPLGDGGTDVGPTPTELFVASIAGCVAFYARRYLARHHLAEEGLRIEASHRMSADRPARIDSIHVRVHLPHQLPAERIQAVMAVASHCTLHNTLTHHPAVSIELAVAAHAGGRP